MLGWCISPCNVVWGEHRKRPHKRATHGPNHSVTVLFLLHTGRSDYHLLHPCKRKPGPLVHSSNPRAVSSTSKHRMWGLKEMDAWSREHRQREGGAAPAGKYGPCASGPAHLDFSFCFHPVLTFESSVASLKPLQFEGDLRVFCACLRKEKYFLGKYLCNRKFLKALP